MGQDQQPLGLKNFKYKVLLNCIYQIPLKTLSGLPAASRTSPLHKSEPCGPRPKR